jgi:ABC-type hemin transport system ATPase subunit
MSTIIQTNRLTKSYGRNRGIIDVTFAIQEGEVFGFLGPNGAGKTTTMRVFLPPVWQPDFPGHELGQLPGHDRRGHCLAGHQPCPVPLCRCRARLNSISA